MSKLLSAVIAAVFAVVTVSPVLAADTMDKKEATPKSDAGKAKADAKKADKADKKKEDKK